MLDAFAKRHPLLAVTIVPIVAQAIGSAFNISYNLITIRQRISSELWDDLVGTIIVFNSIIYPLAVSVWIYVIWQLRATIESLAVDARVDAENLLRCRKQAINLPWYMLMIGGAAWLSCIPVLLGSLDQVPDSMAARIDIHLTISILVSAMIALTHAFFAVELVNHRYLFPILFGHIQPSSIDGAYPLSLRGRGIAWTVSTVFCPIVSILLLFYASGKTDETTLLFPSVVGVLGVLTGTLAVWMLGRLYGTPLRKLSLAAQSVSRGELDTRVEILRSDEFGPLIAEFNNMTRGLQEKEQLQTTFGLHVGREAAKRILESDAGLGGNIREITVMFVDIRGFTSMSAGKPPGEVVDLLNQFFNAMVDVVESQCHGVVNKFLGDGFMALFGAIDDGRAHPQDAVRAGIQMLDRLVDLNKTLESSGRQPLFIGIGIHTGPALVGSIGCEQRLEFTAIGETVNLASRIEPLTKRLGVPMLVTETVYQNLTDRSGLIAQAVQEVRGVEEMVKTYAIDP